MPFRHFGTARPSIGQEGGFVKFSAPAAPPTLSCSFAGESVAPLSLRRIDDLTECWPSQYVFLSPWGELMARKLWPVQHVSLSPWGEATTQRSVGLASTSPSPLGER